MNDTNINEVAKKSQLTPTVKILLIVSAAILLLVGILAGSIYGAVRGCAKGNENFSKSDAERIAKAFVLEKYGDAKFEKCRTKLVFERPIQNSYFVYEVSFDDDNLDIVIKINARTGMISENTSVNG